MKTHRTTTLLCAFGLLFLPSAALHAGSDDRGSLSASFETNTTYYFDDAATGATAPEGRFGSNNYLKLDYAKGGFTAGVQLEGYLPALTGYFSGTLSGQKHPTAGTSGSAVSTSSSAAGCCSGPTRTANSVSTTPFREYAPHTTSETS